MVRVLPYEEAREHIVSGDLVFVCTKGRFHHNLIQWFTGSDRIHVGILFWLEIFGEHHLMISEANGGAQRRIVNLSHYKDYKMDIVTSPVAWEDVQSKAVERLGQVQYNWIEAGYVGVSELMQKHLNVRLPKVEFPGEICSEFVANVLNLQHTHLSPAGLYRYLTEQMGCEHRLTISE